MNAHPAGPRHAEEFHHSGVPPRPESAEELLQLAPNVWPRNTVRGDDGIVSIAGVSLQSLAQDYGTPLFVIDEDDFRSRCREMAAAFGGGANVHYAGKAFLSSEIARWINEEGLSLDVCSGGELAVALHADFPPVVVRPEMPTIATAARMPTTTIAMSNSMSVNPFSLRSSMYFFMTLVVLP